MKKIFFCFLAVGVLGSCGNQKVQNGDYSEVVDSVVAEPVSTPCSLTGKVYLASDSAQLYKGEEVDIEGLLNGKSIGKIGHLGADGTLKLDLPEVMPDSMLASRPGTDVKGGGMTFNPDIRLMKDAKDYLVYVYVNRGYEENGTTYPQGWSFAYIKTHQYAEDTTGYHWAIMGK